MGFATMIIGIGFGIGELVHPDIENAFPVSAGIWTLGGISTIMGLTLFEKEGSWSEIR